jgi:DUF917 family protein
MGNGVMGRSFPAISMICADHLVHTAQAKPSISLRDVNVKTLSALQNKELRQRRRVVFVDSIGLGDVQIQGRRSRYLQRKMEHFMATSDT